MFFHRFSERKSTQTRRRGKRPSGHTVERRRHPAPATPREHLEHLAALPLLNRLPTPTVAVGLDGEVVYANPAFGALLGYTDCHVLTGKPLSHMMAVHAKTSPRECVVTLRAAAGTVTAWRHVDGYPQHAVVSRALLQRATDPLLLVTLTDVTDLLWSSN